MPGRINKLYNTQAGINPTTTVLWEPSYWYALDGVVLANTSSWVLNPFNPNTPIFNVYNSSPPNAPGFMNLSLIQTPPLLAEACGSQYYVSGTIQTQPTFRQLYGYFEASIAVSTIQGVYYTFGLHTDQSTPPQIDIANILALQNTNNWFNQAGVWDMASASLLPENTWQSTSNQLFENYDVTQFHLYGVDWQKHRTKFYLDRILVFETPALMGYRTPMFPLFGINCGVDGIGSGPIMNPNDLPALMQIKSVQVYPKRPF